MQIAPRLFVPPRVVTRAGGWQALVLVGVLLAGDAGGAPASTGPADVSLVEMRFVVSPRRARRVRNHLARPRPLPRALVRRLDAPLVVVAAAGEVATNTFAVSVAVVNRSSAEANGGPPGDDDVEDRLARAALSRLTGVRLSGRRGSIARADDLLSTVPSTAFCAGLAPELVTGLASPVLHLASVAFPPWTPGELLRNAIGLAFRACGRSLPTALLPADVERLAEAIRTPGNGTTSTTLPEECDGVARLEPMTLTDPPYPGCLDIEWITPIPDCADDLAIDLIDDATGQPLDATLFGHTTHVTYFFGVRPVRLVLRACNRDPGNAGGASVRLSAVVSWGG